jgi:hypothetical protein
MRQVLSRQILSAPDMVESNAVTWSTSLQQMLFSVCTQSQRSIIYRQPQDSDWSVVAGPNSSWVISLGVSEFFRSANGFVSDAGLQLGLLSDLSEPVLPKVSELQVLPVVHASRLELINDTDPTFTDAAVFKRGA